jgi:hypothetical protein
MDKHQGVFIHVVRASMKKADGDVQNRCTPWYV